MSLPGQFCNIDILNRLGVAFSYHDIEVDSVPKAHMQLYNVYMARHQPELALKEADKYMEEYPDAKDKAYVQSMTDKLRKALKPQQ